MSPPDADDAVQHLRMDCSNFFDRVPEPPVYSRKEDPARRRAAELAKAIDPLLVRCVALQESDLAQALRLHAAALAQVADGRLDAAERLWREAREHEGVASALRQAWTWSGKAPRPVYDRQTGTSRFDPSAAPTLSVRLACPYSDCRDASGYSVAATYATHRFNCPRCGRGFFGYFGEARAVEMTDLSGRSRRYQFRVQELNGGMSQITFEEAGDADFWVAQRDLLAFLYTTERQLKAVVNLATGRLLWVVRAGPCFVATVAFGDGARELAAFRAFRDDALSRSALGRASIAAYYRLGPRAAGWLRRHPRSLELARAMLRMLHRQLVRRGFA